MNRSDAEKIYNKLSSSDKHLMGIIGVVFAYEFSLVIWHRLYKIICKEKDSEVLRSDS